MATNPYLNLAAPAPAAKNPYLDLGGDAELAPRPAPEPLRSAGPPANPFQPRPVGQSVTPDVMRLDQPALPQQQVKPGAPAPAPGSPAQQKSAASPWGEIPKMTTIGAPKGKADLSDPLNQFTGSGLEALRESAVGGLVLPAGAGYIMTKTAGDTLDALFTGTATRNPMMGQLGPVGEQTVVPLRQVLKHTQDYFQGILDYQDDKNKLAHLELESHGVDPKSIAAQAGDLAGASVGMMAKFANPIGLQIALLESGVGGMAGAQRQGFSFEEAAAKGLLSSATIAAMSALPGGEAAGKNVAALIAKRAGMAVVEGAGFTGLDAIVNHLVLGKDMTKEEFGKEFLKATAMMIALKAHSTAKEVGEVKGAKAVTKNWTNWRSAENGIKASIQENHGELFHPDSTPAERTQALQRIQKGWQDLHALEYAKKAGMKFTGPEGKGIDPAQEVRDALAGGEFPSAAKPSKLAQRKAAAEAKREVQKAVEGKVPVAPPAEEATPPLPVDQIRDKVPEPLKERYDTDMAPYAEREARSQADLAAIQKQIQQQVSKARNEAKAQRGKDATDADVQRILAKRMEPLNARLTYLTVEHDAIQQAKEATANRWRKLVDPNFKEAPDAVDQRQEPGSGQQEHPGVEGVGPAAEAGGGDRAPVSGQGQATQEKAQVGPSPFEEGLDLSGAKTEPAPAVAPPQPALEPSTPAEKDRAEKGLDPTPEGGVPDELKDVPGIKAHGKIFTLPATSIHAAPRRLQFRQFDQNTGLPVDPVTGASGSMADVEHWDEEAAQVLAVWRDPADGLTYVVNGHNSLAKANELGIKELPVRYLDAKNADEAMAKGALLNMFAGNGTPLDAAVFLRANKLDTEALKAAGIPLNSPMVRDGLALAGLPDPWWEVAANDREVMRLAIDTGKAKLTEPQSSVALKELGIILKRDGDASGVTNAEWKSILDRVKKAKIESKEQASLFDMGMEYDSPLQEEAKVVSHFEKSLLREKKVGSVLTASAFGESRKKADVKANEKAATMEQEAKGLLDRFHKIEERPDIGEIIHDAAQEYKSATTPEGKAEALNRAAKRLGEAVAGDLKGRTPVADAGRDGGGGSREGVQGKPEEAATEPAAEEAQPVPEVKPKAPAKEKPKTPFPKKPKAETPKVIEERRKDLVRAAVQGDTAEAKALRHDLYSTPGLMNGESDPTPEQIEKAIRTAQTKSGKANPPAPDPDEPQGRPAKDTGEALDILAPKNGEINPEAGAVRIIHRGTNVPELLTKLGQRFRGLFASAPGKAKGIFNDGVRILYKQLDDAGMLQHPYDPRTHEFNFAKSLITGEVPAVRKGKDGKNMDIRNPRTSQNYVLSPHQFIGRILPNGETPNVDLELAANRYTLIHKGAADLVKDIHERNQIPDHSERVGRVMDPHRNKINELVTWLEPLVQERSSLTRKIADAKNDTEGRIYTEHLAEFNREHSDEIAKGRQDLDEYYVAAKDDIRGLADTTPEVRVALWMEPIKIGKGKDAKKVHQAWLQDIIKPNEIKAAEELLAFTAKARDAGKALGIPMRSDEYITHLIKPEHLGQYGVDKTGDQLRVARDILAFHRRQENSTNLMPSTHAAMAYYVPTISRKIATQPFLNKWYKGGKNPYLDPNPSSPYHAPQFGEWLQKQISDMQNPTPDSIVDKGLSILKTAEITKAMALNQRVTAKHLVGKVTTVAALHGRYMLPAMKDAMVEMAHRPENWKMVQTAYKKITGKDLERNGKSNAEMIQLLTSNVVASRALRNAINESPLIAEYNEPIFNSFFQGGRMRQAARALGRGYAKTRNFLGQPLLAVEAMENGLNALASARRGVAADLSPEQNIKAMVTNLLDYSFRGGHDSSAFLRSKVGRLTAFSQTPSKMLENYASMIHKAYRGEKDLYGGSETATLIRQIVALGTVTYLGEKYGKKGGLHLQHMLFHVPFTSPEYASDFASFLGNKAMATMGPGEEHRAKSEQAAQDARARMVGSKFGPFSVTPSFAIGKDVMDFTRDPEAFLLSTSAVQGARAELPKDFGNKAMKAMGIQDRKSLAARALNFLNGKVPEGYEDALHYLANAPTEEQAKFYEFLRWKSGFKMTKSADRKAERMKGP